MTKRTWNLPFFLNVILPQFLESMSFNRYLPISLCYSHVFLIVVDQETCRLVSCASRFERCVSYLSPHAICFFIPPGFCFSYLYLILRNHGYECAMTFDIFNFNLVHNSSRILTKTRTCFYSIFCCNFNKLY